MAQRASASRTPAQPAYLTQTAGTTTSSLRFCHVNVSRGRLAVRMVSDRREASGQTPLDRRHAFTCSRRHHRMNSDSLRSRRMLHGPLRVPCCSDTGSDVAPLLLPACSPCAMRHSTCLHCTMMVAWWPTICLVPAVSFRGHQNQHEAR